MSGILFLAHRLPFPPDRGDKIRSHHVLQALARLAPVHVGCFAETGQDRANEPILARLAASYCMPHRRKPLVVAGAEALLRREPASLAAFRHRGLMRWVAETIRSGAVDTIYVFSGQMGQYVPQDWAGRLIVDLVDVDSAKFEAYAKSGPAPVRWMNAREGRLLRGEEARLTSLARTTLLVSDAEAALLRSRLPCPSNDVQTLGNGIDAALFDPETVASHPALTGEDGPHCVFTGQMDYAPNVAAALRVAKCLLPEIRRQYPAAQFHIVGRAPVTELRALDGKGGVRVWGAVADVRPFLAAADLVIAPLDIARGVQNKVLEAMAMARPVLLTRDAATGIAAEDGVHLAIADDDRSLAARACALLANPGEAQSMGRNARRFVNERMNWPAMLKGLPSLVGRGSPERRDAA